MCVQELEASQANYTKLQEQLAESQRAQLELSESLLLLQHRADHVSDRATGMSPVSAAVQSPSAEPADLQQDLDDCKRLLHLIVRLQCRLLFEQSG